MTLMREHEAKLELLNRLEELPLSVVEVWMTTEGDRHVLRALEWEWQRRHGGCPC